MAKYLSKTENGECVFCQIIARKIKTPGIFWEDKNFMALLSIYPNTEGFTVVVPKQHFGSDVLQMPEEHLQQFILAAKKVAQILTQYFDDVGRVGVIMEGTGVDHAHIKLFPMHGTGHLKQGKWKQYCSNTQQFFGEYPKNCVNYKNYILVLTSKIVINWLRMMPQFLMGLFHFLVISLIAK